MSTRIFSAMVASIVLVCVSGCAKRALERQLGDASASGNLQEIQRLLSRGADINSRDGSLNGWTSLMWALYEGHDDAAQMLLAAGADPNIKDGSGRTALFFAATGGDHSAVIKALIRAGARTDLYRPLFEGLPLDDPNRIAFQEGTKTKQGGTGSVLDNLNLTRQP